MTARSLGGLTPRKLRVALGLFFLALAVPTAVLIHHAYGQLKWEAFHQQRLLAEELVSRIDGRLRRLVDQEEGRSFADYGFLVVAGERPTSLLQRSPLSTYPIASPVPGLVGYFQVDAQGALSTPTLPPSVTDPAAYGLSAEELAQRRALQTRIEGILAENRLVHAAKGDVVRRVPGSRAPAAAAPAPSISRPSEAPFAASALRANGEADEVGGQAAFDRLAGATAERELAAKSAPRGGLGRVEELNLDSRLQSKALAERKAEAPTIAQAPVEKRAARRERSTLPEAQPKDAAPEKAQRTAEAPGVRVATFESEIDPLELSLLDSGHFVLYRKVWRDGQRYVQGMLIDQSPFLQGAIDGPFRETSLSGLSDLVVAYQGRVLSLFPGRASGRQYGSAEELSGALLTQLRLSAPLGALELVFSLTQLPVGPGGTVVFWLAAVLALVLCGGFYLMYRLGLRQIALARQQQDFVSAVSHELKTPLTAIRMYGEMLHEGWASEERRQTYYDYIYAESERLSRLINNVLQLARMTRRELQLNPRDITVGELVQGATPSVASQLERARFALSIDCEEAADAVVHIDPDCFAQILINLVDNAVKFSAGAERREVEIGCHIDRGRAVVLSVRDYGPGVPKDQMKKIFRLFYRPAGELTRQTAGTGIGLALVRNLAEAMGSTVDVVNRSPGAEFQVRFPVVGQR